MQTKADRMYRIPPTDLAHELAKLVDECLKVVPVGYRVVLGHTECAHTIRMFVVDNQREFSEASEVLRGFASNEDAKSMRRRLRVMATRLTKKARVG